MTETDERIREVRATMNRIRTRTAQRSGIDRVVLREIRAQLVALARRTELFPHEEFPATGDDEQDTRLLHCEPDGSHALYLFSSDGDCETPPHDHGTWAVIVGIHGIELNRLYRRLGPDRFELVREVAIGPGEGLCLMPDDIHAIASPGKAPLMHLHLYGQAFEDQQRSVPIHADDGGAERTRETTG
ncbi:MAG: cysteine dioxygenase [Alphaproteobacteria bacterium]|nr:cysteine dioxygenase [Alphaproteobacteria bacterium]